MYAVFIHWASEQCLCVPDSYWHVVGIVNSTYAYLDTRGCYQNIKYLSIPTEQTKISSFVDVAN